MAVISGLKGLAELSVTEQDTAAAVGSGSLPVFATPRLAALMERAACAALEGRLGPDETSVGTRLELSHDAATPVGQTVRAEAEITAVDRRKIIFFIRAFDNAGPIGSCIHQRFLVHAPSFVEKALERSRS